jgi:hypothetical protein
MHDGKCGKPKGEQGARVCRTCLLWETFKSPTISSTWSDDGLREYDVPSRDRMGWCGWTGHHQMEVTNDWYWCDAWVPHLGKV